jgi:RHS repeat-associated protein
MVDEHRTLARVAAACSAVLVLLAYASLSSAARPVDDEDDLIVLGIPKVTLSLTNPPANNAYTAPASIAMTATAKVAAGSIPRVDYYQGSSLIGTATTMPYSFTWGNVAAGQYALTARARSTLGFSASSTPVNVKVCGAPTVTLTAPTSGAIVNQGDAVNIQAQATSPANACAITKVEFYEQIGAGSPVLVGTALGNPPYQATWTTSTAATYTLTAKAYDERGVTGTSSGVTLIVNSKPTVTMTSPAANATFNKGSAVSLAATASDSDGSITKVEFFTGSTSLGVGTLNNNQYTATWTPAAPGAYSPFARATDNRNATTDSSTVGITVCFPSVSFTAPTAAQVVNGPSVTLTASASTLTGCGSITKVEFYNGATLLATVTASPYTYNWLNVAAGSYTITARAYDSRTPVQTVQASVSFTVNAPPTATLSTTVSGTTYNAPATLAITAPGSLTLNATATDSDGTIAKVEFYDGATLLGTATSAPYSYAWSNILAGAHSVTSRAYDNRAATGNSPFLTINSCGLPTVAITSPSAGQLSGVPGSFSLAATASTLSGCGTITKVEFYNGAALISTATSAPYTGSVSGLAAGTYTFSAKAYSSLGSTSQASVTATVCGLPTTTLTSPPAGQTVAAPGTFTLSANASTNAGCSIQKVEFYNGTTLLNTDTASPFSFSWSGVAVGSYTVKARGYDTLGQFSDSASVTVTVITDRPPTISSVTPTSTQLVLGGSTSFAVVASDSDAGDSITVRLLNGATVLATGVLTSPNNYALAWTPGGAGTYSLTVQVTDSFGQTASQSVSVTVVAPPTSATPNPDQVIPASYPTPAIGTIAGSFGVSDSGAANYTIPIQVPPGTAGMQPNLALAYNSQGGNGLLGVGWSLSGLSAITRCPQTIAQDGVRSGINYDSDVSNDRFCLDGQRLVPIAGPSAPFVDKTYNDSGINAVTYEYRTELDTYSKIVSYQESSPQLLFGPYRFRVWTKSGQILDFGLRWWIVTAGWTQAPIYSGLPQPRPNVAKVWVLDRVMDRSANFMEIDYADRAFINGPSDPAYQLNVLHLPQNCGQGRFTPSLPTTTPIGALPNVEYWPTAIRYYAQDAVGSECGSSPNNQVIFTYEDVPSQANIATRDRYYDSGAGQTSLSKRVTRIDTSADATGTAAGTLVKSYFLSYLPGQSQQTQRSLLQSVQECSADGACLPATQFEWAQKDWNATGHSFALSSVTLPFFIDPLNQGDQRVYVGDWNGDGKSDLLGWASQDNFDGTYTHNLVVCLSTGSGFNCGQNAVGSFASYTDNNTFSFGNIDVELMDANNDGRVDIVFHSGGNWTVCLSSGDFTCTIPQGVTWRTSPPNGPTFRGDLDGDGRIDVLTYLGNTVFETCLTRDNGFLCFQQNLGVNPTSVGGVNYGAYPYSTCGTYPSDPASGCEDLSGPNVQYQVLVADANGDGNADIIRRRTDDSGPDVWKDKWKVCFADFNANRSPQFQFICADRFVQGPKVAVDNAVLFDFNGDGIADMAGRDTGGLWRVCLSTGDGAFEFYDPAIHWDPTTRSYKDGLGNTVDYYTTQRCRTWQGTGGPPDFANAKTVYGDFNGDGRTDIAGWDTTITPQWKVCLSTGSGFSCSYWPGPYINNADPDLNQWVVSGDFNGDGKTDMLCLSGNCNGQLALSTGPPTGDVMTKVTTGLGATTQITYAPLTDSSVYSKGSGASSSSSELDIQSPIYVVKETQASNGLGGFFVNDYFYENLRGRTDGRGLYGFFKKRMRDGNGIVTESEYLRVAPANYATQWTVVGRPSVVRKYAPTPASYVADITNVAAFNGSTTLFGGSLKAVNRASNTWLARDSSSCGFALCGGTPRVREALLTQTVEESWELDGTALPSMTSAFGSIDQYGNPQQVTVSSSDGYSKATTNTYLSEVTNYWVIGRLTSATVTLTKPGVAPVQRKSSFTYHGVNGNCAPSSPVPQAIGYLCDEMIEPDLATDAATSYSLWQQTSYQYDIYGNRASALVQFKERDGTLKSRTTTTAFGYNGRFPTTVTNTLGQYETRQFDTHFGTMTRQQGPNGIVTTSLYDGFGRKYGERVFDVNGYKISEAFSPVEATGLQGREKYRTRSQVSGGSEMQSYFDELQRNVRTLSKAFATNTYATATTIYDSLGRKSQMTKPAGGGTVTTAYGSVSNPPGYDVLNRPTDETTTGGSVSLTSHYAYGTFGSLTVDGSAVGGGGTVTVTQSGTGLTSRSTKKYTNSQGQTVRVTDGQSGNTDFSFDAYGNLAKTIGPTGIAELMSYDRRGRKTSLTNPDSGAWTYQYNGTGELVRQIDAKGQTTVLFYDPLGRTIERREHPGSDTSTVPFVTVSTYDAYADGSLCARGVGKLCETRTATVTRSVVGGALANPETRSYTVFDPAGRAAQGVTQVDNQSFESITTFDANGRVDKLVYPSGFIVVHRYTSWSGQLDQVAEWANGVTGTVHWQAGSRYADGQIKTMQVGAFDTGYNYDGFGRVCTVTSDTITADPTIYVRGCNSAARATGVQSANYAFDALGNLSSRVDPNAGQGSQTFSYDLLNRVTSDGVGSVNYYADGRFNVKDGSAYSYVAGTHRLASGAGNSYGNYDPNGNVGTISNASGTRRLTYTAFNLPSAITGPGASITYIHDGAHARIKEVSSGAASSGTTYYLGGFEQHLRASDNVLEQRHYLRTPEGIVGIVTLRSNGSNDARYWHKDHIGSVAVITDAAGSVKEKFKYDAWGNRSVLIDAQATGDPYNEERGYTGHEQLVEVGLTHMNGRIYDPVTGSFLQADPVVQDPWNGQNYNRYSYVLNNPLSFTDPTGFSFWTKWRKTIFAVVAAVIVPELVGVWMEAYAAGIGSTAFVEVTQFAETTLTSTGSAVAAAAGGFAAGGIQGGNIQSAVQGAIFAELNFGIGQITSGATGASLFGNGAFAANVGLHAALGCAQQAAAGGHCKAGALSGGFSALAGPLLGRQPEVQFAGRILIGGIASRLGGDKFSNGAITAAFEYLFNYCSHEGKCTSELEQFMYDWWPAYKLGTCINNGDCSAKNWTMAAGAAVIDVAAGVETKGIAVIGHFPGYTQLAERLGAEVFNMGERWAAMNTGERWAANKAFLDSGIERGVSFVLATDMRPGITWFRAEVQYLLRHGYEYGVADGMKALVKRP